jgi:murein DD-endopeptidase MepM/ murein hydrolase activator NlpD
LVQGQIQGKGTRTSADGRGFLYNPGNRYAESFIAAFIPVRLVRIAPGWLSGEGAGARDAADFAYAAQANRHLFAGGGRYASLKPVVTATPKDPQETASPERRICSPLVHHGLDELAGIVSDPYHPPPMGKDDRHQGVDFSYYRQAGRATIEGEGVQSVMSGRVAAAIQDSFPFGNLVIIESTRGDLPDGLQQVLNLAEDQSLYVLYAHLEEAPLVQSGDAVQACQALGAVGKSGNAGVAHLHLETRVGPVGAVFSELAYYTPQASQSARANYVLWRMSGVFEHFDPMLLLGYRQAK